MLSFNPRKRQWEENATKEIVNMYTINNMAWRSDSLYLITSSLCGGVEMFETVAKYAITGALNLVLELDQLLFELL